MDKDDKNNNDATEDAQKDLEKKEIPLWLQGLNNSEEEKLKDKNDSDETKTNHWIDEIDQEEAATEQMTSDEVADSEISDDELPGWISELSRVEDDENLSSEDPKTMDNKEENNPWNQPSELMEKDEETKLEDQHVDEHPESDGFIEISGIGLSNSDTVEPSISNLQPNENEELPDWLQEMVSEPDDQDLGDTSPVQIPEEYKGEHELITQRQSENSMYDGTESQDSESYVDEIEETDYISSTPNAGDLETIQENSNSDRSLQNNDNLIIDEEEKLQDECIESEDNQESNEILESSSMEEAEEHLNGDESKTLNDKGLMETSEEDTVPINLSKNALETEKLTDSTVRFLPKILLEAKEKLSTDEFDRGLQTINIFIDEDAFLVDIESWLEELTIKQNSTNFAIWEALGDLRVKKGEHTAAMSAYEHATHLLIKIERDNNGSD